MIHAFGNTVTNTDTTIVRCGGEDKCKWKKIETQGGVLAKLLICYENADLQRECHLGKWLKCDHIRS